MDEISEELVEEIRACSEKKNFDKCVDKLLEKNGIPQEDKPKILENVIKQMDSEAKRDDTEIKNQ